MTSYINHFVSQTNVYIHLRMFIVVLENKIKNTEYENNVYIIYGSMKKRYYSWNLSIGQKVLDD